MDHLAKSKHAIPSRSDDAEDFLQIVSFRAGGEEFGIDILRVQEIIRNQHLTRVPNSSDFVDGVINLRGQVIPVITLSKRLGIAQPTGNGQTRIVVMEVRDMVLGFIVDSVPEVLRILARGIEPPPRLSKVEREYVYGVAKLGERLLLLLDVERIMGGQENTSAVAEPA